MNINIKDLEKNPKPWTDKHTQVVKNIKIIVITLPCWGLSHPEAVMIVETDASDMGYGEILKQIPFHQSSEQLVSYG